MTLLGLAGKIVILGGFKPAAKLALRGAGALASPLTKAASAQPLFKYTFKPGIRAGVAIDAGKYSRFMGIDHIGKTRTLGLSHGTAGTAAGTLGTAADHYEDVDKERHGELSFEAVLAQELAHAGIASLATRAAGQTGLRAGLSVYARSTGPLLLAEGLTYGATGALSKTKVGQDMGFDKPMGFTEMNFETGRNLGTALLNSSDDQGTTFRERSISARDKAADKKYGGSANPFNYESDSVGELLENRATWAVDTFVRRPGEKLGIF